MGVWVSDGEGFFLRVRETEAAVGGRPSVWVAWCLMGAMSKLFGRRAGGATCLRVGKLIDSVPKMHDEFLTSHWTQTHT